MRKNFIINILDKILNRREYTIQQIVDTYFSNQYEQCTNGVWDNRQGFIEHLKKLREIIKSAHFNLVEEVKSEDTLADIHRVIARKYNGDEVIIEVYLFAKLDTEGKIIRIKETTLMLKGKNEDKEIGSIK